MLTWFCFVFCMGQTAEFKPDAEKLGVPFERFTTTDSLGRTITGYLSRPPANAGDKKLPLMLFVGGSGCQSAFTRYGDKINSGLQGLLYQLSNGRARVLVVEKPGVKFLDTPERPGGAIGASKEFLAEHTLPRWGAANVAALQAALKHPGIDSSRVLVSGHSEGGIVAARVAAECPHVTHVAPLSCSGTTQLFSLLELARRRAPADQKEAAVNSLLNEWNKILAKPDSIDDFWMGHPYRRWSTFLKHSVIDELKRCKAKVYIAHGTDDQADSVVGFDVMYAELLAQGRDVAAERIEGGDHGFSVKGQNGMAKVFGNVVEWFLKP